MKTMHCLLFKVLIGLKDNVGSNGPMLATQGMGKKGLTSAFFGSFYLTSMEQYLGPLSGVKLQAFSSFPVYSEFWIPTEEKLLTKIANRPGLTNNYEVSGIYTHKS